MIRVYRDHWGRPCAILPKEGKDGEYVCLYGDPKHVDIAAVDMDVRDLEDDLSKASITLTNEESEEILKAFVEFLDEELKRRE